MQLCLEQSLRHGKPRHLPLHKGGTSSVTLRVPPVSLRLWSGEIRYANSDGSDSPLDCHSIPRRRFATQEGKAYLSLTWRRQCGTWRSQRATPLPGSLYIHFSKTKKFKIFIYAAAPRILRFGRRLGKTPAVIEFARLCHNCSVRNFPLSCSLGQPTRTLCISPFTPSILRNAVLPDCSVRLIASFA